ncbi:MAG: SUMF1/EgtB/PvdO family nonheme iron enzyme [Kiritimatiellae bacterium]|nr:SUMF1/EgtB/PvdO family nonheme iron enzyme [Kiritimatiellia bacterium]
MKRKAVFVGVDQYDDEGIHDLQCAANDAALMLAQFRAIGFDPVLLPNPTRDQVMREFRRITAGLGEGDEFLFYFAGHGFASPGGNDHLLFCRDDRYANIQYNFAGIPFGLLQSETERAGLSRIFIVDACRSNPFTTRGAGQPRDLLPSADSYVKNVRTGGLAVMRSCGQGQCALELPSKRRGVFSLAMDEVIGGSKRSGIELVFDQSFLKSVYDRMGEIAVENDLQLNQTPEIRLSANWGRVVLVAGRAEPTPRPTLEVVACPLCGRKNLVTETFRCRVCGADNLCLSHSSGTPGVCKSCAKPETASAAKPPKVTVSVSSGTEARTDGREDTDEWSRREAELKAAIEAELAAAREAEREVQEAIRRAKEKAEAERKARELAEEKKRRDAEEARQAAELEKKLAEVRRVREAAERKAREARYMAEGKTLTLPGGAEMRFRWCPAGTFTMGSPTSEDGRYDNETQHRVTLTRGFWMGEAPVTQEQWESVMGNNPSNFKGANLPVEQVSWNDCQEFIKKVNSALDCGARLPTEAEWEYACRAGTTGAYGGSGNLDEMGWYDGNSGDKTHPVGQKKPNAWGLCDMHGNVWEWCSDWFGDYPSGSVTDPTGPSSGSYLVLRGGSWRSVAWGCRSAYRYGYDPDGRFNSIGLRLLCSAGPHE